jgi:hypothetical protein
VHGLRESKNTQSPGLRFRALLTEGGDRRVQLHRASSSPVASSANFSCTGFLEATSTLCCIGANLLPQS